MDKESDKRRIEIYRRDIVNLRDKIIFFRGLNKRKMEELSLEIKNAISISSKEKFRKQKKTELTKFTKELGFYKKEIEYKKKEIENLQSSLANLK